ncbi:MAG: ferritin-like domain-containing protein [Flavobacteriales bacterium]
MKKIMKSNKKTPVRYAYKNNGAMTQAKKTTKKKEQSKNATLHDLLEEGLKDIYSAESQLVKALPKMAKAAKSEELKAAFLEHLEQTKGQVERLNEVFRMLDISKKDVETCEAMKGLVEEGDKIIEDFEKNAVRDAALIIGAQKVEHYEIASYGSLCEIADILEHDEVKELLGATLEEEESTDENLNELAKQINSDARDLANEGGEKEDRE